MLNFDFKYWADSKEDETKYTPWFDRLLHYHPGFRRYIYGLARFIYPHKEW